MEDYYSKPPIVLYGLNRCLKPKFFRQYTHIYLSQ
eukprot:COSAG01_NODE_19360_length_1014_cov_2.114754_2_plen_34_part_01